MPLRFGLPLTWLGLAALAAVSYALNADLYWPVAIVAAALAGTDAKRLDASRFESFFPLEPAGTFLAVLLALPIALPWYLRLHYRIGQGRLKERTRPRSYVPGIVILTGMALLIAWFTLRPPGVFREVREVQQALAARTDRPFTVTLRNQDALVTFVNVMPGPDSAAQRRDLADRAAECIRGYYRTRRTLGSLNVTFSEVTKRGMVTTTRPGESYSWTSDQLLEASLPQPAVTRH